MKKIKWSLLSLLFVMAVLLVGCSSSENSGTDVKDSKVIKIGYQKGNTINILKASGILDSKAKEEGYSVKWIEFTHGGTMLEGIFTGNIDFGHAADGSGINAQAAGKPFVYVGADAPNPEGVGILVHKASTITSVEQLKGKKVAALKGGNHHYLAVLAVKAAGLQVDDVKWVYLSDASQLRAAFETKQIDALATYDPFFAGTEIDLDTINLTEGVDYGYPNRTFYYANVDFNDKSPELVSLILEAIDESDQWANENKVEVAKIVSKELGISVEIIERAVNRRTYGVSLMNDEILSTQQKQADVYVEIGIIPEKIDVRERVRQ